MLERFTQEATKVIMLAQEEARRCSLQTVGCEQLLLGLIREGSGSAAGVLKGNGVDLVLCRASIDAITGKGKSEHPWYKKVFSIKLVDTIKFDFSEEAKAAMRLSSAFAKRSSVDYIDTAHLLIGILEMPDNIAIEALKRCHADPAKIKEELISTSANSELKPERVASTAMTDFPHSLNRAESVSKMTQLGRHVLNYELVFLLMASFVIYSIFPHLPGVVFSGKVIDAIILALIILACRYLIAPLLTTVILLLGMLSPWRSKLLAFGNKLGDELKRENKEDGFGKRRLVRPLMGFSISLCVFIVISMLDPNMLRGDSWYALPIAAAIIAIVMLFQELPVKKLLGNKE